MNNRYLDFAAGAVAAFCLTTGLFIGTSLFSVDDVAVHYKHYRDVPSRAGESMMVAMVTEVLPGEVGLIGCPADSAYGPVGYQVVDAEFAAAGFVVDDYVPIYYRWERDRFEGGPGRYHFAGWASYDEVAP